MKNSTVVTRLLFQEGKTASAVCLKTNAILGGDYEVLPRNRAIIGFPVGCHYDVKDLLRDDQKRSLELPLVACDDPMVIGSVIAATIVAHPDDAGEFIKLIRPRLISQMAPIIIAPVNFCLGCILGLFQGAVLIDELCKEGFSYDKELLDVVFSLIWANHKNDDFPPHLTGQLSNDIAGFVKKQTPQRKDAIAGFINKVADTYSPSEGFPSLYAERVVTEFQHKLTSCFDLQANLRMIRSALVSRAL